MLWFRLYLTSLDEEQICYTLKGRILPMKFVQKPVPQHLMGHHVLQKNVAITWCIPHFCTNPKDPKSISGLRTRNNMAETRASCRLIDLSPPCVAHTI